MNLYFIWYVEKSYNVIVIIVIIIYSANSMKQDNIVFLFLLAHLKVFFYLQK